MASNYHTGPTPKPDVAFKAPAPKKKVITQSELNRLAKELSDLRSALQPFAAFAEQLPPIIPGANRVTDTGPMCATSPQLGEARIITFGDIRNAKTLLDRLAAEDQERVILQAENDMAGKECEYEGCGKHFVCTNPVEPGADRFCSSKCLERFSYWSQQMDVDFNCCGGTPYSDRGGTRMRHCTDCENYTEPP